MSRKNTVKPAQQAGRVKPGKVQQPSRRDKQVKATPSSGKSTGKVQSRASRPSPAVVEERRSRVDMDELQQPSKTGIRWSARKARPADEDGGTIPAATPTPGAFGKTGSLSPTEEEIIHTQPAPAEQRDDFLEKRRRENKRARK